ncbi:protein PYRICULARIA ORYZAE RESISTANCE 21 isoform X4 [Fagus crenata]
MGEKKTTLMVLKVDLQCCRCYKKVKKVLCRIPQIQDQVYNEKENCVVIKVVCCSPEKIKQKLICKGCGCIKSVEIKEPPPPPKKKDPPPPPPPKVEPPPPPPPKVEPPPPPPPKEEPPPPPPPKVEPPPPPPPKVDCPPPPKPVLAIPFMPFFPYGVCCGQCYGGGPCYCGGPCHCGCGGHGNPPEQPPPPPPPEVPRRGCCGPCSEGRGGGPCHYEGYGRPVYDSYGGGYYCQEDPSGCTIM